MYSFEQVIEQLGLGIARHDTPKEVKQKDLVKLRRFVWRNYRCLLSVTKNGWFGLSRRKRAQGGNGERLIFTRDKAISQCLWFAADFAKRNKLGAYSVKQVA